MRVRTKFLNVVLCIGIAMFTLAGVSYSQTHLTVPAEYSTIQAAINAADPGNIIDVAAGTYTENVTVTKAITIIGAGAANTNIVATDANHNPLTFSATGASVSGFTITHNYTPTEISSWSFNNNGVSFTSGGGNTLTECTVTLNRNGIYINTSQNNIISENVITNNRTGINMTGTFNGTQITSNVISDNWTLGLVSYATSNAGDYSTVVVSGNTFDNNWYTEIEIKDASTDTGVLDVTGNIFTDNPVTYNTSSDASLNEPGFAAQIPDVPGINGTAAEPANPLPTLRIYNSGSVGLQYDNLKTIMVESGQSIQTAINNYANNNDIVSVEAGSYSENISISKSITLKSASGASSTSIEGIGGTAITINSDNVTIDDFTISNPSGKSGIFSQDHSNISIKNNIINNIGSGDASVTGTNFGIAITSYSSAVDNITIQGNTVSNIAGGDFKSADGIAAGWSNGNYDITGLVIQNNNISNISSSIADYSSGGRGAYGIILNHAIGAAAGKTVAAQILNNTISDLDGLWSHGIGLEGNTPDVLVQGNSISSLTDHKTPTDAAAINVEDNSSADVLNIHLNNFSNVNIGVQNKTALDVHAENNWWDSITGPTIASNPGGTGSATTDHVLYSPWLTYEWTGIGYPETIISWPINNATIFTTTPLLNWYQTFSTGSVTYEVLIRKSTNSGYSGSAPDYFDITGITGTSVTVSTPLTAGTKYYYKVRAQYSGGLYIDSKEQSFTVDLSQGGAVVPTPSWPVDGATVYSTSPTLRWYLDSGGTGLSYQIQYSGSSTVDGNGALISPIAQLPALSPYESSLSYPISSLSTGIDYYWQVRSYDGTNWSDWSPVANFIVNDEVSGEPAVPVPGWPVSGETVYSVAPTLNWYLNVDGTGLTYDLRYSTSLDGGGALVSPTLVTSINNPSYQLSSLTPGETYYWQVMSTKGAVNSDWSDIAQFKVLGGSGSEALPTPVTSWPTGDNTVYTSSPTFSWYLNSSVATNDYTFTLEIKKQVLDFDGTGSNDANSILITGITDNSYTLTPSDPELTSGAEYHWRVKMVSGALSSPWSDTNPGGDAKFNVVAISGSIVAPKIGAPDHVAIVSGEPTLSWFLTTKPASDQNYRVELSRNPDMSNPFKQIDNLNSYKITFNDLTSGTYFWRVQALTGDNKYSDYSKIGTFNIEKTTGVEGELNLPKTFRLSQNYPNPFNPTTEIQYDLPKSGFVSLKVYNMLGQEVKTLVNEQKSPGNYTAIWDGKNNLGMKLASGVYIYRLAAGNFVKTLKMIMLK